MRSCCLPTNSGLPRNPRPASEQSLIRSCRSLRSQLRFYTYGEEIKVLFNDCFSLARIVRPLRDYMRGEVQNIQGYEKKNGVRWFKSHAGRVCRTRAFRWLVGGVSYLVAVRVIVGSGNRICSTVAVFGNEKGAGWLSLRRLRLAMVWLFRHIKRPFVGSIPQFEVTSLEVIRLLGP